MLRGIRGATTVERNDAGQIAERTRELLRLLVERNGVRV
jgi:chorismate mutase